MRITRTRHQEALGAFGYPDTVAGRRQWLQRLAIGRRRSRGYRASPVRKAHDASMAEALLAEGLAAAELSDEDLRRLAGSEPRKVAVARAIWERTTVPTELACRKAHDK
jgi:ABC-type cobalamin/Fe3+-siderophores transport system ATPase subunit